jgi:hypothetical protein
MLSLHCTHFIVGVMLGPFEDNRVGTPICLSPCLLQLKNAYSLLVLFSMLSHQLDAKIVLQTLRPESD